MSEIFRKKSLDKINSPEDLNQYMRVTNPSVWVALVCVILLLSGGVFWGMTARLETTASAFAVCVDGENVCYVGEDDASSVAVGNVVRIGDDKYRVLAIHEAFVKSEQLLTEKEMSLAGFSRDENICVLILDGEPLHGGMSATVVTAEKSPMSFLFNGEN